MKQLKYIVALMFGASLTTACVDDFKVGDAFLEKAPGVDVNIDSVFAKPENARNFLWSAYGQIYCTYHAGNMMNGAPIDALSDSWHSYCGWSGMTKTYYPGNLTEDSQDNPDGNYQGKFSYRTMNPESGRVSIYETVRKCWQIINNIDRVPNMSEDEKGRIKGEAYTIMASRYFDAFRNFGGLCLVDRDYAVGEEFNAPRATAMETVVFIDTLINRAINQRGFIWNVPNDEVGLWEGRLTRASAMALRCKVWMHAASPLFNNAEPYLSYGGEREQDLTIWFGGYDRELWTKCKDACEAFFKENGNNDNFYQLVQATEKTTDGYRKAYRQAYRYRNDEVNHEKLFDAHPTTTMSEPGNWGWSWTGYALDGIRQGGQVPTAELMECFGMADGRNYPYTDMDIYGKGKNSQGIDIFADRDPRLYETIAVPQKSIDINLVGDYQSHSYVDSWQGGVLQQQGDLNNGDDNSSGLKRFKWWLDHSTSKLEDKAIGVSYIRLAEVYLIYAEALAELDEVGKALIQLNKVRARVGLADIEKANPQLGLDKKENKDKLVEEILRERNCEIGAECGDRLYDMIRRKRQDLFTKPLHELHTYRLDADGNRMGLDGSNTSLGEGDPWPKFEYERNVITNGARRWWEPGFWTNKWYLDPVSRVEIQKGYGLTQNPGY